MELSSVTFQDEEDTAIAPEQGDAGFQFDPGQNSGQNFNF